jgi:exodeoxyribonuclease VII small subunit
MTLRGEDNAFEANLKLGILNLKLKNMATKKVTYKEAITEIEEILEKIENEELDVDELAEQVNRVSALITICNDKLHKTESEVEKILKDMNQ